MSLWRSPILYVGIVLILLVSGLLSAPFLVNWNTYRSSMEDYGKKLTGRDVRIVGDISVHLFPWPRLRLEGVRIANPPGTMVPELMRAEAVEARMLLGSLISGYVDVSDIRIEKPIFSLERLASGEGSWWLAPELGGASPVDANRISIDRLRIVDGIVFLSDIRRGGTAQLNDFNAEVSAQSLLGPWKARGELQYKDLPLVIGLSTGKFRDGDPFKFGIRISPADGGGLMYSFEGDYDAKAEAPVSGLVKAEPYVAEGGKADSQSQVRPLTFKSKLTFKSDRAVLDNIEIAPADQQHAGNLLTGSAYVDITSRLAVSADLRSPKFDLDSVLGNEGRQILRSGALLDSLAGVLQSLPDTLDGDIKLNIGNLLAGGQNLENVTLAANLVPEGLTVSELSATMPGQTKGKFSGLFLTDQDKPQLSGDLSLESANLRELASWLVPEWKSAIEKRWTGARGKLSFTSKLDQAPNALRLSKTAFTIDDTTVSGGLTIGRGTASGTSLRLIIDRLDLDRYAPDGLNLADMGGTLAEKISAVAGVLGVIDDMQLVVQADSVAYNGVEAKDLAADIAAKGDNIEIRALDIGSVGDARLELAGILEPKGDKRQGSASFSVSAIDPRPLLRLVGLIPPSGGTEPEPSWAQALGPVDMTLRGELDLGGQKALATMDLQGTAGGSLIAAHGGYDGTQASPAEANLSFDGNISSPSEKALAVLFGIGGQTDEQDRAELTWKTSGQWINGLKANLELHALGALATFDGTLVANSNDGALTADGSLAMEAKQGDRILAAVGIPTVQPGSPLRIDTEAKIAAGNINLTNFHGTIDQTTYDGNLSLVDGNINVAAETSHLSLPWLLRYALLPADGRPIESVTLFSTEPLGGVHGTIDISSQVLKVLPGIDVQNSKTELAAHDGKLSLSVGGIGPAGAPFSLDAQTARQNDELLLTGSFEGGLDLGGYFSTTDGPVLSGPVAIKGTFGGHGRSPAGMALTLAGSGGVQLLNATLKGFDAHTFTDGLARSKSAAEIDRILRQSFTDGETSFAGGEGKFVLRDGEAVFGPLPLDVGEVSGTMRTIVELASGKFDLGFALGLKAAVDVPPVELAYSGARDALVRSFDASSLKAEVSSRALKESMDKLEALQEEQQRLFDESDRQEIEQAERDAALEGEKQKQQEQVHAKELLLNDMNIDELERRLQERDAYQLLASRAPATPSPSIDPVVEPQANGGSQTAPTTSIEGPASSQFKSSDVPPVSPLPDPPPNSQPTVNAEAPPASNEPRSQNALPEGFAFPQSTVVEEQPASEPSPAPTSSPTLQPPPAGTTKSIAEAPAVEVEKTTAFPPPGEQADRGPILLLPSRTGSLDPNSGPTDLGAPPTGSLANPRIAGDKPPLSGSSPSVEPSFFERLLRIPPNEPASSRRPSFNGHNR